MLQQHQEPIIQSIEIDPSDNPQGVMLSIKREDLIHPEVSGNKWRKLKYNLAFAQQTGHDTLLTFGGAFSNHIFAVAAAAKELGLKSIGVIRGEAHLPYNPTLQYALDQGMTLKHISRADYKLKTTKAFQSGLTQEFGKFYLVPEGGTNAMAIMGAAEIVGDLANQYDLFALPVGTGGTMSGIVSGLNGQGQVLGFASLKGDFLESDVRQQLDHMGLGHLKNYSVNNDYTFGGYAKYDDALIKFINHFKDKFGIPLDPIYTGKMMYGIMEMIRRGEFPEGSKILVIHTGGLQGVAGFNQRFGDLIDT